MKKTKIIAIATLLVISLAIVFTGCNLGQNNPPEGEGNNNPPVTEEKEYTIQYTDSNGTHQIKVKSGELYSLESIPQKTGYKFLGLYDAETGGTQYVNASGSALAPFTDNKNIVLFPQFAANEFTLVLDYQGAPVTGERQMAVSYGTKIATLPVNVSKENKEFVGWFTKPDCQGLQVADKYGVIPGKDLVTETNFDLSDPNGYIYLYAGFRGEMFTVTFYFGQGISPEEKEVEYGTFISDVVPDTRVDGMGVYKWSTKENDTELSGVFTGKVVSDMVLYAAQLAPVIDFDSDGGQDVKPIIAQEGEKIVVPDAKKDNYVFDGWYTPDGNKFEYTIMPATGVKLKAKWKPMLVFDTRGGTEVDNISAYKGEKVELPSTSKDGYVFAGWYDEGGNIYTSTAMPEKSIVLKAMWYKSVTDKIVVISDSTNYGDSNLNTKPSMDSYCKEVDLSAIYSKGVKKIEVIAHYKSKASRGNSSDPHYNYMDWFSQKTASEAYRIWSFEDKHTDSNWVSYTQKETLNLTTDKWYISFYASRDSYNYYFYWTDFWLEVNYPDTTVLY